jgi:acetoin utilization deacetylase AcuC-like enzyme
VVAGDRFGRLALTEAGLARRERLVIKEVAGRGIPLCIVLAGGYAPTPVRTAELHAVVFREVERWLGSGRFARGG